MCYLMNVVCSFMNYAIFRELCNRMRFEVDCVKSHHRVIPEGLNLMGKTDRKTRNYTPKSSKVNCYVKVKKPQNKVQFFFKGSGTINKSIIKLRKSKS